MRRFCCRLLLLVLFVCTAAAASLEAGTTEKDCVSGPFWDLRYGEAVVGSWGLKYGPSSALLINGRSGRLADLEKNPRLKELRGCPAFARCGAQGEITVLELIAPQTAAETGEIWQVAAGEGFVRCGDVLNLRMRAPRGGRGSFSIAGAIAELKAEEISPGVYAAAYAVPRINVQGARVIGIWSGRGREYRRVGPAVDISSEPPIIVNCGPVCRPRSGDILLFADYRARGTDVDPRLVRVWAGDKEITSRAVCTDRTMVCRLTPEEAAGNPLFCVKITDRCGGSAQARWRWDEPQVP